jgi:hypothetical protein
LTFTLSTMIKETMRINWFPEIFIKQGPTVLFWMKTCACWQQHHVVKTFQAKSCAGTMNNLNLILL